jgi:hypothetical protein
VKLPRKLATAALVALAAIAVSAPAQASTITPGYFLYSQTTGAFGPCANGLGAYIGTVSISTRVYKTVDNGTFDEGSIEYRYFYQEGFNKAGKYHSCVKSYPSYSYYGAYAGEIRRTETQTWACNDMGNCQYLGSPVYGAWKSYQWA